MDVVYAVNGFINELVWGPVMIVLLLGTGVFLSLRLRFPQIRRIGGMWC